MHVADADNKEQSEQLHIINKKQTGEKYGNKKCKGSMCDRISGGEFLDRNSENTGFITAYCGICRERNLMDKM